MNMSVRSIEEVAIDEINEITNGIIVVSDLSDEKQQQLKATIESCTKAGYMLLQKVFNRGYYPLMDEVTEELLMKKFLIYTVLNVLYPYTKDAMTLTHIIKDCWRYIEDLCVDYSLLYVIDTNTDVYNLLGYLSETFYNIY